MPSRRFLLIVAPTVLTIVGGFGTPAAAQADPDLKVALVSTPQQAAAGANVILRDTTSNIGTADAAASTTRFYLSTDSLLDVGDTVLGARAVDVLTAGSSSTGDTTVTIPIATATGKYYILASADDDLAVAESDETNNTDSRIFKTGPNLVIKSVMAPAKAGEGQTLSFSDTTKNVGTDTAGASKTKLFFSSNATLDGGDTLLGMRDTPALTANAENAAATSVTLPSGLLPGTYYLIGKADGNSAVTESSETDNTKARSIAIGPDLVTPWVLSPSTLTAGVPATVKGSTKNIGGGVAAASYTRFYLSTDGVLDGSDTFLVEALVNSLTPGTVATSVVSLAVPNGTTPGIYYLLVMSDGGLSVAETKEGNNTRSVSVTVP
ncbi:MAG: hypothetical protein HYX76_11790 [Acidobacteria bacterium]|nr:hypothetical protein [Acidobacteriota bacterium]